MFERESHAFEYHASKVLEQQLVSFKRLESEQHVTCEEKLKRANYDPA